ncbi:MAG: F0F1 ATP synthase subunit A [Bacteriovoracaceae bacterium]
MNSLSLKFIKLSLVAFIATLSTNTFAAGGFTWIGSLVDALHIPVPDYTITFLLIGLVIVIVGLVYQAKVKASSNAVVPDKGITIRNIIELYGNFIRKQCKEVIGEEHADTYFPFVATIFIFIFVSNFIGLIPGFLPPTEYLNTALALGVFSFVYYNIKGVKEQGLVKYVAHFAGPLWYLAFLIFPIEIISNFIRPVSLALRLRSNMMGDHIVLTKFSEMVPLGVPIIFMVLGLLVSFIQAYVFTVLSMVYINLAISHHDHDEEHAH